MVDHIQLQPALAPVIIRLCSSFQFVLSAGHDHKSCIGPDNDTVKIRHLNIGLQHNLLLPGEIAVGGAGQRLHPSPPFFRIRQSFRLAADAVQRSGIGSKPAARIRQTVLKPAILLIQRTASDMQFLLIQFWSFLQLSFQRKDLTPAVTDLILYILIRSFRLFPCLLQSAFLL